MTDNYLNLTGLERVAEEIKRKEPLIFKGTAAEWENLSPAEQNVYGMRIIDDDFSETEITATVVDVVAENNANAVSSGAVYAVVAAMQEKPSALEFVEDDEDYTLPAGVTPQTGETFDTITATVNSIDKVYGLGKINDVYTRIVHPDGDVTTLSGF